MFFARVSNEGVGLQLRLLAMHNIGLVPEVSLAASHVFGDYFLPGHSRVDRADLEGAVVGAGLVDVVEGEGAPTEDADLGDLDAGHLLQDVVVVSVNFFLSHDRVLLLSLHHCLVLLNGLFDQSVHERCLLLVLRQCGQPTLDLSTLPRQLFIFLFLRRYDALLFGLQILDLPIEGLVAEEEGLRVLID